MSTVSNFEEMKSQEMIFFYKNHRSKPLVCNLQKDWLYKNAFMFAFRLFKHQRIKILLELGII